MKSIHTNPVIEEQIIAFVDLMGYHSRISSKLTTEETFVFLSDYYSTVQCLLDDSPARIVKFIGDTILIVFPSHDPNQAIVVLRKLKTAIDGFLVRCPHDSRFRVKAHVGNVAAGTMGIGELARFDVCGPEVNQAALLPNDEWVLSDALQKRTEA